MKSGGSGRPLGRQHLHNITLSKTLLESAGNYPTRVAAARQKTGEPKTVTAQASSLERTAKTSGTKISLGTDEYRRYTIPGKPNLWHQGGSGEIPERLDYHNQYHGTFLV